MYTNKWRNGQKRNDFLARKCIYQYLSNGPAKKQAEKQ